MADIPFRTFEGFLKQHDHASLSDEDKVLVNTLFPSFEGSSADPALLEMWKKSLEPYQPFFQFAPPESRPRRFAGMGLPRRCYHSVAHDASGEDQQTLAHELRAYRDPLAVGMVEVLDLASGAVIDFGSEQVRFEPERALAVLIHGPERLPARCRSLAFSRIPGIEIEGIGGKEALLYRLPYVVAHRRIENCVDLRFPEVRRWFFEMFRTFGQSNDAQDLFHTYEKLAIGHPELPTVAQSRFVFRQGRSQTPQSFWEMLPTLLNPDLGGGDAAGPGASLHAVAHWMRNHGVGALVYPSARADVGVSIENGVMKGFRGWNLVDYATAAHGQQKLRIFTSVLSPWAWLDLPQGVKLVRGRDDSSQRDSFLIEGMVNYWARDYLAQVRGLRRARLNHGVSATTEGNLVWCACLLGMLLVRWVRMVFDGRTKEEIDLVILEIVGLALPRGLYPHVGRLVELHEQARSNTMASDDFENGAADVVDLVRGHFRRHAPPEVEEAMFMGYDLETTVMQLAGMNRHDLETSASLAGIVEERLATWSATGQLPPELRADIVSFTTRAMATLRRHAPDAASLIARATELQSRVLETLRGR
jgi:hypothetical protein